MKKCAVFTLMISLALGSYAQSISDAEQNFLNRLSDAAIEITKTKVTYDPSYFTIDYPNGDIPAHLGVNADVVIRVFRKVGVDLQKEVHEDIKANFDQYPKDWGLTEPDTNIDHRRVPNLQTFFKRKGQELEIDQNNESYLGGDIVTWKLPDGVNHIGIVTNKKSRYGTPLVVHNSASGQVLQNILFHFKITGHYRYIKNEVDAASTEAN